MIITSFDCYEKGLIHQSPAGNLPVLSESISYEVSQFSPHLGTIVDDANTQIRCIKTYRVTRDEISDFDYNNFLTVAG